MLWVVPRNVVGDKYRNDVGNDQKHKHLLEWPLSGNTATNSQ